MFRRRISGIFMLRDIGAALATRISFHNARAAYCMENAARAVTFRVAKRSLASTQ